MGKIERKVETEPTIEEAIKMGQPVTITLAEFQKERRELSRQAEA